MSSTVGIQLQEEQAGQAALELGAVPFKCDIGWFWQQAGAMKRVLPKGTVTTVVGGSENGRLPPVSAQGHSA